MTTHSHRLTSHLADERGVALLIAVIVLLLMSALGLAALQHAGDEASGSGRSRRKDATLYAAESGLQMVKFRFREQIKAGATNPSIILDEPTIVQDPFGNPIQVRSGLPANGTLPAAAVAIEVKQQATDREGGYDIREGSSAPKFNPLRADVTAKDQGEGLVHLIAQYRLYEGPGSY